MSEKIQMFEMENGMLIIHDKTFSIALTMKAFGKPVIRNNPLFKGEKLFCTTFSKEELTQIFSKQIEQAYKDGKKRERHTQDCMIKDKLLWWKDDVQILLKEKLKQARADEREKMVGEAWNKAAISEIAEIKREAYEKGRIFGKMDGWRKGQAELMEKLREDMRKKLLNLPPPPSDKTRNINTYEAIGEVENFVLEQKAAIKKKKEG